MCVGIPKTVDNDLPITDNCPGFGSVAKYVAILIREAGYDVPPPRTETARLSPHARRLASAGRRGRIFPQGSQPSGRKEGR